VGKVSIIIPVYNEARTIRSVLDRIKQLDLGAHEKEVIVLDANSTDGTKEILQEMKEDWLQVVHEPGRRGTARGSTARPGIASSFKTLTWSMIPMISPELLPQYLMDKPKSCMVLGSWVIYNS
jgi:glycosyltransferase involved in cell wall biosynthesis